jgi:hypothetical protein
VPTPQPWYGDRKSGKKVKRIQSNGRLTKRNIQLENRESPNTVRADGGSDQSGVIEVVGGDTLISLANLFYGTGKFMKLMDSGLRINAPMPFTMPSAADPIEELAPEAVLYCEADALMDNGGAYAVDDVSGSAVLSLNYIADYENWFGGIDVTNPAQVFDVCGEQGATTVQTVLIQDLDWQQCMEQDPPKI